MRGFGFKLVVNVQNKHLEDLGTREVIPLYPLGLADQPMLRLNPIIQIDGERYFLATQEMAAVKLNLLGAKVASLQDRRDEIVAAIDFLITGV
jgi:toxin CcdB